MPRSLRGENISGSAHSQGLLAAAFVIFRVGVVAGTLDILDALLFNAFRRITPTMVFQYIASGLLDGASFDLGLSSVFLGALLHYLIALGWTAVFYVASRKFSILICRLIVSGLLYGLGVYLLMNIVVLPLSRSPRQQPR